MISATERLRYIVAVSLIGIQSEVWIINHCLGLVHEKYYALYVLLCSYDLNISHLMMWLVPAMKRAR